MRRWPYELAGAASCIVAIVRNDGDYILFALILWGEAKRLTLQQEVDLMHARVDRLADDR